MRINNITEEEFWDRISVVDSTMQQKLAQNNSINELRKKAQVIYGTIECSKLAMLNGRTKRAWAFYLLACKILMKD